VELPPLSCGAIYGAAAIAVNASDSTLGQVLLLGGYGHNIMGTSSVRLLDLTTGVCTPQAALLSLLHARSYFAAAGLPDGRVVCAGGFGMIFIFFTHLLNLKADSSSSNKHPSACAFWHEPSPSDVSRVEAPMSAYLAVLAVGMYVFFVWRIMKIAIETKRSHYRPLRRALLAQGHILPEGVVIVACVRGSIPASTLDTLRNDLGLNRAPAETILRKTHLAACEHMRRMIHTRRGIEALTMGPQGIVTELFQRDKTCRGRPPHGNAPPKTSRPRRPNG